MKKKSAMLLALLMAVSAAACGNNVKTETTAAAAEETVSETETAETEGETAADDTPAADTESTDTETETAPTQESTMDAAELDAEGQDLVRMNPQEAGKVNVKDLVGYCVYGFNKNAADIYAAGVANTANALKDQCTVYEIMIPNNSAIMLDDATKQEWNLPDEKKAIKYYNAMTAQSAPQVVNVGIYDTLTEHNSEYLYFHTDHHWTQLGAYYTYYCFCQAKGLTAHTLDEYQQIVSGNFLGSYYSTSGYAQLSANPDTMQAYVPIATNTLYYMNDQTQTMCEGHVIYDMNSCSDTVKYMGFISGDRSYSYVDNPNMPDGDTCIVVKESFGNAFVPFLVDHYKRVIVIDYRYYTGSLVQLAKDESVKDIIFINNLEAISDVPTMQVLQSICQ